LHLNDRVPDEKTIWLFRDELTTAKLIDSLFDQFDETLSTNGFAVEKGPRKENIQIDATIVSAPKQRNRREENKQIKEEGKAPESWNSNKKRQKDTDARWTKNRNISYFGYKNHVNNHVDINAKHKFIRRFEVTSASVHDSQAVKSLLDKKNGGKEFYADSAYAGKEIASLLDEHDLQSCIHEKGYRNRPLTEAQKDSNRKKSKIRSRVEHIFGVQSQRAGSLLLRGIALFPRCPRFERR